MTDDPLDAPMSDPIAERLAMSVSTISLYLHRGESSTFPGSGNRQDAINQLGQLDAGLRDLVETAEDAEHSTEVLREEIHKCHEALDVRCIDQPSKVGCEDMVFETHKIVAQLVAERNRLLRNVDEASWRNAAKAAVEMIDRRDAARAALREIREIDIAFWKKRALSEAAYRTAMETIRRAADAVLEGE